MTHVLVTKTHYVKYVFMPTKDIGSLLSFAFAKFDNSHLDKAYAICDEIFTKKLAENPDDDLRDYEEKGNFKIIEQRKRGKPLGNEDVIIGTL